MLNQRPILCLTVLFISLGYVVASWGNTSQEIAQPKYLFWLNSKDEWNIKFRARYWADAFYIQEYDESAEIQQVTEELWEKTSLHFQNKLNKAGFRTFLKTRAALGPEAKRRLESIFGGFLTFPGLPENERYAVVSYDVIYANKPNVIFTEQFTFWKKGSDWLLAGNYLAVKPFHR